MRRRTVKHIRKSSIRRAQAVATSSSSCQMVVTYTSRPRSKPRAATLRQRCASHVSVMSSLSRVQRSRMLRHTAASCMHSARQGVAPPRLPLRQQHPEQQREQRQQQRQELLRQQPREQRRQRRRERRPKRRPRARRGARTTRRRRKSEIKRSRRSSRTRLRHLWSNCARKVASPGPCAWRVVPHLRRTHPSTGSMLWWLLVLDPPGPT
mmetsp:Transcript_148312/g.360045  ORF Transcript_148312/g.360045 Transcript_148312/m.360045 type:complete len:209 (+) Transcript_148312:274-900(+)